MPTEFLPLDKRKIAICILARLVRFSYHWYQRELNSFNGVSTSTVFYKLYEGITGESYIPKSKERCDATETLRVLWGIKSRYLLACFLDSPWSPNYRCDPANDIMSFFHEYRKIIETLDNLEQAQLLYHALQCEDENSTIALCKLFQPKRIPRLSKETGTSEDGARAP